MSSGTLIRHRSSMALLGFICDDCGIARYTPYFWKLLNELDDGAFKQAVEHRRGEARCPRCTKSPK